MKPAHDKIAAGLDDAIEQGNTKTRERVATPTFDTLNPRQKVIAEALFLSTTGGADDTLMDFSAGIACHQAIAVDAAIAAMPMNGWQPIKTAPRDGTAVLGWRDKLDAGDAPLLEVIHWSKRGGFWFVFDPYCCVAPTYWHPLTTPPRSIAFPATSEDTDHA